MRRTMESIAGLVALIATACGPGTNYSRPSTPAPPAYKEAAPEEWNAGWKPAQPGDQLSRGNWWARYDDAELNQLETKLNASNQNIAAAAANVETARAVIRQARAQFFPSVTANPSITNARVSSAYGKQVGVAFSDFALPFQASWEPDLFGRVRNTVSANTAAAQASVADLENVRLAAQAQLAADYYELRAQDALKSILDSAVAAYQEAAGLNRDLYTCGLANDEAVAQAEAQWKTAQAQAINLGILRAQYEHAIAVLVGAPPAEFSIRPKPVALSPPSIPVGVPSELLERRPDIAASERAVAQANAQIGIARTAYYPSVTLSASAGFEALSVLNWMQWPSRIWSVGPSLAQTIFDAGLRRATVQQYRATYDATVANYRQTVLTAFQQVEDNLSALRILSGVVEEQNAAITAAQRNVEEAQTRYQAGLDPYLNVIAAQTALWNDEQSAITFREQQMVASVQLIEALGGGWDRAKLPSAEALSGKASGH